MGASRELGCGEGQGASNSTAKEVDTMIMVDVDGVLNVGAAEDGQTPIMFDDSNLATAKRLWNGGLGSDHPQRRTVESLISISEKRLNRGEVHGETLAALAAKNPAMVSDVLVERLAEILHSAGTSHIVVLTSTWQAARNRARVQDLENRLSALLGRTFEFDAGTGSEDTTPEGRLEAIGTFVAASVGPGGAAHTSARTGQLRVLILEDFFVNPLARSWSCGGKPMDSKEAVEGFVRSKVPSPLRADVELVHTYDEWRTPQGRLVRCGVGLSPNDVQRSKDFLVARPAESIEILAQSTEVPKAEVDVDSLPPFPTGVAATCGIPVFEELWRELCQSLARAETAIDQKATEMARVFKTMASESRELDAQWLLIESERSELNDEMRRVDARLEESHRLRVALERQKLELDGEGGL